MTNMEHSLDSLMADNNKEVVDKLNDLQKNYKATGSKGELSFGENFVAPNPIPTGIPELDNIVLGIGGIAEGRVVEFAGETNAGKTTLALNFAREAIKLGKSVVIAENEGTFTSEYAESIGLAPHSYMLLKGAGLGGDEWLEEIMKVCEAGADVIIIDSLFGIEGASASEARLKDMKMNTKQSGAQLLANFAKLWKNGWEPFYPNKLKRGQKVFKGIDSGTTLICIHHLKPKFGGYDGEKDTPGSKDIQFLYSQRIWLTRLGMSTDKADLDEDGNPIYTRVRITCQKSKMSPGGRKAVLYLDNRNGQFVTDSKVIVEMAENKGIVVKKGAWIVVDPHLYNEVVAEESPWVACLDPEMKWQGAKAFVDFCNENPKLLEHILKFDTYAK